MKIYNLAASIARATKTDLIYFLSTIKKILVLLA